MAVDIRELFDEELPFAIAKNPDAAKQIGAKYQINVLKMKVTIYLLWSFLFLRFSTPTKSGNTLRRYNQ